MMPNPWLILGAISVCIGTYFYGHHAGWVERDQEMQLEIARKNDEAREKERQLSEQLNNQNVKLKEANNVLDQKQSALDRAIRAGRVRISTPTGCVQAAPSAAAPAGDSNQARSQPDRQADQPSDAERETLRLIAQIVADGDRAINQLNACIDAYNQVMETINGKR
jgi:hypothetical protein